MFKSPQVNLYVEHLEASKVFYEKLGFRLTFTAEVDGRAVHHELLLDGFTLGIATKTSAKQMHGLKPGRNTGCELVFWVEDTDAAIQYLLKNGAAPLSEPHNFLDHLRSGWVQDPDGNPIQIVCRKEK